MDKENSRISFSTSHLMNKENTQVLPCRLVWENDHYHLVVFYKGKWFDEIAANFVAFVPNDTTYLDVQFPPDKYPLIHLAVFRFK